jgi:hypothetical protein
MYIYEYINYIYMYIYIYNILKHRGERERTVRGFRDREYN